MTVYPDLAFIQGVFLHGCVFVLALFAADLRRPKWMIPVASLLSGITSALYLFPRVPLWGVVLTGCGVSCWILHGKTVRGTVRNLSIGILVFALFLCLNVFLSEAFLRTSFFLSGKDLFLFLPFCDSLVSSALSFAILRLFVAFRKKRSRRPSCVDCEMELEGKTASFRCYADSGNFLTDPVSGMPTVILEFDVLRRKIDSNFPSPMTYAFAERFGVRAKVIPYRSVSGDGQMLSGFVPDRFCVGGREYRVVVAVTDRPLEENGCFSGIIGPDLWEGVGKNEFETDP